jgi:hypothetical protein
LVAAAIVGAGFLLIVGVIIATNGTPDDILSALLVSSAKHPGIIEVVNVLLLAYALIAWLRPLRGPLLPPRRTRYMLAAGAVIVSLVALLTALAVYANLAMWGRTHTHWPPDEWWRAAEARANWREAYIARSVVKIAEFFLAVGLIALRKEMRRRSVAGCEEPR